jgi:hypothetical protein
MPASVEVSVTPCSINYTGAPDQPPPPSTFSVQSALAPPEGGGLFGAVFVGTPSYVIAPASSSCQGDYASADGGEAVMATAGSTGAGVVMVLRAGGAGPSTDLACPYIPAVQAADQAFRGNSSSCNHPSTDVVHQISTGTSNVYAAAVWVPADVKDVTDFAGKGNPTVALFTAKVSLPMSASGVMIACTLPSAEQSICNASLQFFLTYESGLTGEVGSADLTKMATSLSGFLSEY